MITYYLKLPELDRIEITEEEAEARMNQVKRRPCLTKVKDSSFQNVGKNGEGKLIYNIEYELTYNEKH